MEEILRRIKTLEQKVDHLMQKEEYFVNENRSIIQELNNVKETTTTILNILNSKHRHNNDNIITSINLCKQTKQQHLNWVSFILELLDERIAVGGGGAISLNQMNYETKEVEISMPKYEIKTSTDIKSIFKSLGMSEIFNDKAHNFEPMVDSGVASYIKDIKQKAVVKVDEKGSEAAAVTAVTMKLTAAAPVLEMPKQMFVERPFIFMIKDSDIKKQMLFIAKIEKLNSIKE